MEFNKILFPAPLSSYTALDPDLIWIPRKEKKSFLKNLFSSMKQKEEKKKEKIPCFYLPYYHNSCKKEGA